MPQLAPLMWMVLPVVLFMLLGVVYCCVWWGKKPRVGFSNVETVEKLGVQKFFWCW
uniref:ATP synthase F0 subunit 8 n=1 Tax=Iwatanemertes piperata TaxID=1432319 RepID=W5RSB8_9BILA|nr:ATP synthase F0 subunit 8 [Iwatanemertes piperata]AHB53105.1 ATP synthase F0 subunit 8 [Iwatanemertes piperata]